jgi:hypothetical protein
MACYLRYRVRRGFTGGWVVDGEWASGRWAVIEWRFTRVAARRLARRLAHSDDDRDTEYFDVVVP